MVHSLLALAIVAVVKDFNTSWLWRSRNFRSARRLFHPGLPAIIDVVTQDPMTLFVLSFNHAKPRGWNHQECLTIPTRQIMSTLAKSLTTI